MLDAAAVPDTALITGLLGHCDALASQRPSVAPSACLVAGRADRIALPGGARYDIVRSGTRGRVVVPAQCQTRHPDRQGLFVPGGTWVAHGVEVIGYRADVGPKEIRVVERVAMES